MSAPRQTTPEAESTWFHPGYPTEEDDVDAEAE